MSFPIKGTKSYTAHVVRPSGSKAATFDSGHKPTEAEALRICLYTAAARKGKNIRQLFVQEWEATGDGSWSFMLCQGYSARYTPDEALAKVRAAEAPSLDFGGALVQ